MSEDFSKRVRRVSSDLTAADLAKFDPLPVTVYVYEVATNKQEQAKDIDMNKFDDREWFLRTLVWCLCHNREITVINQRDDL